MFKFREKNYLLSNINRLVSSVVFSSVVFFPITLFLVRMKIHQRTCFQTLSTSCALLTLNYDGLIEFNSISEHEVIYEWFPIFPTFNLISSPKFYQFI